MGELHRASRLCTHVPDFSLMRDWDKIVNPAGQLSRLSAACEKRTHKRRNTEAELVGVYGELSPEIGLEKTRCRGKACNPDIHFPPADLIKIEGFRKLKRP